MAGYHRRRVHEVPEEWISKVTIKPWNSARHYYLSKKTDSGSTSGNGLFKSSEELEAKPLHSNARTDGESRPARPAIKSAPSGNPGGCAGLSNAANDEFRSAPKPNTTGEPPAV